jgi:hypothetical protein
MGDSRSPRASEARDAIFCFQRDMRLGLRNEKIDGQMGRAVSGSGRPSWPLSGSGDRERYRREKSEEQLRYWSSPEGLGLTQEEFDALQEPNNPWPRSVRAAVDEVRKVAHGIESDSDAEHDLLAGRIAELVGPIVEYLESLMNSMESQDLEDRRRREEAAVQPPGYLEPHIPAHVMRWEAADAFRRWAENYADAKRQARQVQSIRSLLNAATSLAEIHKELDVVGVEFTTRFKELADTFMRAWELAKHPQN